MRTLESRPIKLSQRDTEIVIRVLANPPKPNARLRRAFARLMEMVDDPPADNPKLRRLLQRTPPWTR